jgi:hypothetical protein
MLIFKEEALQEIRQAQLWYEVQKPGRGERFRRELFSSLRFVVGEPAWFWRSKGSVPLRSPRETPHTSSGTRWKGTISLSAVFGMASRGPCGSSLAGDTGRSSSSPVRPQNLLALVMTRGASLQLGHRPQRIPPAHDHRVDPSTGMQPLHRFTTRCVLTTPASNTRIEYSPEARPLRSSW